MRSEAEEASIFLKISIFRLIACVWRKNKSCCLRSHELDGFANQHVQWIEARLHRNTRLNRGYNEVLLRSELWRQAGLEPTPPANRARILPPLHWTVACHTHIHLYVTYLRMRCASIVSSRSRIQNASHFVCLVSTEICSHPHVSNLL